LKALDRYDNAMLVFTSDHSWRHDPEYEDIVFDEFKKRGAKKSPMKHVPLLIKWPHQSSGSVVTNETFIQEILPLMQDMERVK